MGVGGGARGKSGVINFYKTYNSPAPATDMSVFEEKFYTINRSLLSLIGLWPYMDRRKMLIRTFFAQLGIVCAIIIEVRKFIPRINIYILPMIKMLIIQF